MPGLSRLHGITLPGTIVLALTGFSAPGMLRAVSPTTEPAEIMMLSSPIKVPPASIPGIFVPLAQMPPRALVLSSISPITCFMDRVRYSCSGDHVFSVQADLAVLAVFIRVVTLVTMVRHKRTMPEGRGSSTFF